MLKIIDGDIFESGADIIAHQVNCQGVMGSGVARQVREKFPKVYEKYAMLCRLHKATGMPLLGMCLVEPVNGVRRDQGPYIANLFGQDEYGYDGRCYTDYDKLRESLARLHDIADALSCDYGRKAKLAIPYLMGCHRGGGDWEIVSKMIEEELTDCDVTLYRYTGG